MGEQTPSSENWLYKSKCKKDYHYWLKAFTKKCTNEKKHKQKLNLKQRIYIILHIKIWTCLIKD